MTFSLMQLSPRVPYVPPPRDCTSPDPPPNGGSQPRKGALPKGLAMGRCVVIFDNLLGTVCGSTAQPTHDDLFGASELPDCPKAAMGIAIRRRQSPIGVRPAREMERISATRVRRSRVCEGPWHPDRPRRRGGLSDRMSREGCFRVIEPCRDEDLQSRQAATRKQWVREGHGEDPARHSEGTRPDREGHDSRSRKPAMDNAGGFPWHAISSGRRRYQTPVTDGFFGPIPLRCLHDQAAPPLPRAKVDQSERRALEHTP
jgi:hypothetical protein